MQKDETTNLALANLGSIDSNSRISKYPLKTSRQLTMTAGTNEVALWASQLYIVPFANL
jgi:hypothetical protein